MALPYLTSGEPVNQDLEDTMSDSAAATTGRLLWGESDLAGDTRQHGALVVESVGYRSVHPSGVVNVRTVTVAFTAEEWSWVEFYARQLEVAR